MYMTGPACIVLIQTESGHSLTFQLSDMQNRYQDNMPLIADEFFTNSPTLLRRQFRSDMVTGAESFESILLTLFVVSIAHVQCPGFVIKINSNPLLAHKKTKCDGQLLQELRA